MKTSTILFGVALLPASLPGLLPAAELQPATLSAWHDYVQRYKESFSPTVADSKRLACSGSDQRFSMVWAEKVLFIHAAIEGQYVAHDFLVDERRVYSIANTTEMREIEDYGQPRQRIPPPGQGNGFIWNLHSIARDEERDGGVYIEVEAIALTRDIPPSLRWLVKPVVHRLSVNSLTTSLRQIPRCCERVVGPGGSACRAPDENSSIDDAGERQLPTQGVLKYGESSGARCWALDEWMQ